MLQLYGRGGRCQAGVRLCGWLWSANLRLLDSWQARQNAPAAVAPVKRRPRRRTLLIADTPARIATARARRALLDGLSTVTATPTPPAVDDPFLVTVADALEPEPPPQE